MVNIPQQITGPGSTPFTTCDDIERTHAYIQCNFSSLNQFPNPDGSPLLISVEGQNCGPLCSDTQTVGMVISDPMIQQISTEALPGYGIQDDIFVIQGSGFILDE